MQRRNRQPGFVLLLVIMLLAVCCLIFTQISLKSFSRMNAQLNQERDIEQYWAMVSIRRAVLPNSAKIYRQLNEQKAEPRIVIELSSTQYHLKLENENTKLNLKQAWRDFPKQIARDTVSSELFRMDGQAFQQFEAMDGQIESWRELTGMLNEPVLDQTDGITLWGQGVVDITQADEAVIERAWKGLFGTAPPIELYKARQSWPPPDWSLLRNQLGLRPTQLELADRWFSIGSNCFSLELSYLRSVNNPSGYLFIQDRDKHHAYRY